MYAGGAEPPPGPFLPQHGVRLLRQRGCLHRDARNSLAFRAAVFVGRGHHTLEQALQGALFLLRQRAGHRGIPAPDDLQHVRIHVQGLLRREDGGRALVLRIDLAPDEAALLQMGQGTGDVALVDVDDVRQLVLGQAGLAAASIFSS